MKTSVPTVFAQISDRGWILERLASEIANTCPNFSYGTQVSGDPDIVYYMTYGCRKKPFPGVEIGYFTHIEEGLPAEQVFYDTASQMDACVTQADLYKDILEQKGIANVTTIPCGIDHTEFFPRLQIGVVGRTYHTGRKGEGIIAQLMDMPNVEFHFTGDGWPGPPLHIEEGRMGEFYRKMDYILVPSLYEGGPMCVPEAIACGVQVIAPRIGWVPDFPHIPFEKGDAADLRRVLEGLVEERLKFASAAAPYTWQRWAQNHATLFQETWDRRKPSKLNAAFSNRTQSKGPGLLEHASIVQIMHGRERDSKGGPSVRVPYTADRLRAQLGQSTVCYGSSKAPGYDIAHLYNIWQPDSALTTFRSFADKARKRVFSPILLDLSLRPFWTHQLPKIVTKRPDEETRFLDALPELQVAYARALEQRNAAIAGYQPTPGFAGKLRDIVSEADRIILLSSYEKTLLEEYCGPIHHGAVLRNPVDASFFCPGQCEDTSMAERLEAEFGIDPGAEFMLSVGRVEVRKNQLMKAAIARELQIPLVIAGHSGDRSYSQLVNDAGGGFVHFLGRVEPHSEPLRWLYRNCALFMSLSWAEGASLSILEAAASGAPLLLTHTSGEREYFDRMAAYTSPLDLAEAVEVARKKMSLATRRTSLKQHKSIKERYDWPVHIQSLLNIYSDII